MPKIALGLEYDGTDFVGWQSQQTGRTVEDTLAAAVSFVADETVTVHGSGRTDAGVHALQQVAHFDARVERTSRQWLLGINSKLPADVAVRWVHTVPADFDARRSALHRRYRYTILQQAARPALQRARAWWLREPLDCAAMTAAATGWLGEHDFSAFRAAACQAKSPRRRLMTVGVAERRRVGATVVTLEFRANAFLHHMVRNLVGTLVAVGGGELAAEEAVAILERRDRTEAGVTAPAAGLALVEVVYPEPYGLPRFVDDP